MAQNESSRQLITRAAACSNSGRIPYSVGVNLAHYERKHGRQTTARLADHIARMPQDWVTVGYAPPAGWQRPAAAQPELSGDEWGVGWIAALGTLRVRSHPLAEGYHLLEGYPFPDPRAPGRFDAATEHIARARAQGKYVLATVWFTFFERLWFLRGFNNMLTDPYLEPERFANLRDRLLEFNLEIIRHWRETGVDGIFFSDDWGNQQSLLMNPADWRRFYLPGYRRMFEAAHAAGAQVWMHLCGNVSAIIADLLDAGLNVLNPLQPQALNLEALARDFGGRLCFFGGIDVQKTLPFGTPQQVKDEVRWLCERLGGTGGYLATTSHTIMPETPLENLLAMFEALEECCPRT
jgi:uroporphyrinogen decarboxylase